MRAIELRHTYADHLLKRGHIQLPEHPLVNREGEGTYFNGSALTPNLGYFLGTNERPANALFTQQRVFWTRFADFQNLPPTPVWTIFQVMMSYYLFEQPSLQLALDLGFDLLTDVLGIAREDLLLLLPAGRADLEKFARRIGVLEGNIVTWQRTPMFQVEGQLEGFYCKFLVRHKHGMLPILDIINIEGPNGTVMVDSCMLLERMTFVLQDKTTWYETELFLPLMQAIEAGEGGLLVADRKLYEFAAVVRSLVAALADGAEFGGKGKGYVLKKLLRQLLQEKKRNGYAVPLEQLVRPSLICLQNVGYSWLEEAERIEETFRTEEQSFGKWHAEAERFLRKQVQLLEAGKRDPFTLEDLLVWKDSRGVPHELADEFLSERGHGIVGYERAEPVKQRFITDSYAYDRERRVEDVKQWLVEFEKQR